MTKVPANTAAWDRVTIGLIDAMVSIAVTLNERIAAEAKRMKRSKVEWEWFSDKVSLALTKLPTDREVVKLLRPWDDKAASLINEAVKFIETREKVDLPTLMLDVEKDVTEAIAHHGLTEHEKRLIHEAVRVTLAKTGR